MKWLIFGDVHGNLLSLEQLLKTEKGNFDKLVCHGDLVNYGPWSNECVQLINSLDNCVCLKGNHEKAFLNGSYDGVNPLVHEFFDICFKTFNEVDLISKYESEFELDKYKVIHTVLDKYIFMDTPLDSSDVFENYIIGHSHQQFNRVVNSFEIVNTGSLGQNRAYIDLSEYLVYDDEINHIEFKNFVYNIDILIHEMKVRNYSNNCIDYYRNKNRVLK